MKKVLQLMIAMIILTGLSFGQMSSDITGTVLLPDGSAIPGVAVTLTGDVTGAKTTVTSESGNYRFLQLPPGTYELKFELDGFKTVIQRSIRTQVGKGQTINVTLETSSIKEEVTVSGQTSIVDVRRANVGVNITGEQLKTLPSARNPWAILNMVPGMMLDRIDVGGAEGGQQSSFFGNGASSEDTSWNIDGANLTDVAALGAAPAYLNSNAYEEMQVNLGSNDITAQTGGTQINFISKRGGNRYSGDFYLYASEKAWEMNQTLPEDMVKGGLKSPGTNRLKQYGINFGGPLVNDKLWFFGSYTIQDIVARSVTGIDDSTLLVSGYAKLNFQLGNLSGEAQFTNDDKLKWGRTMIGSANQGPGTLWDQYGPTRNYRASLQYVTGNLMISAKGIYTDGGFTLDPRGADVNPATGHNEGLDWFFHYAPTRYYDGAVYQYGADRNSSNFSVDGNYFLENTLGGDHEWKFGVDYFRATSLTETLYPNQRILMEYDRTQRTTPGAYKEAWFITDGITNVYMDRLSLYLQDTVSFGKLTVNAGIRWDREQGYHGDTTAPGLSFNGVATAWMQQYLPPLSVTGGKVEGATYSVISPRLSLSYDLTGDGKNLLKLSVARYGSAGGILNATFTWVVGPREIDLPWYDNGDSIPTLDEFEFGTPDTWYWWNINEADPTAVVSRNRFADDFNAPLLDELTLSYERALGSDMSVSLTGFYKKRHNLVRGQGILEADANGNPVRLDSPDNYYVGRTHVFPNGSTRDLYFRKERPIGTLRTNFGSDTYQRYLGGQFVFTKKLSNKWMADFSVSISDWKNFFDRNEYTPVTGPTNYDFFNEAIEAPQPGGSGITGVFVNSRWSIKASGLYQLPLGLNLTAVLTANEGYVIPNHQIINFPGGVSNQNVYEGGKKVGDDRLPTFWMLNMGLEKTFRISETATVTLLANGHNITNNAIVMKVNPVLGTTLTGRTERILQAGIFQFGVRVNF